MAEFRVLLNDIDIPDIELWDTYVANGGYAAAEIALRCRTSDEVLDLIEQSGLQDRGGGWYSVAARWRSHAQLRGGSGVDFLCVGGNESEPGTFRDRKLLERNPHQILEGIIIAAYALRASTVYVCLRSDMKRGRALLEQAIAAAREHGWLGANVRETGYPLEVYVHPGGDAYIETEATALLRSIEGFRAEPRGTAVAPELFGNPAEVVNIGTLAYLPHIVNNGFEWFRGIGSEAYPGTLVFCLSGHVSRPGLYELQLGASTLREVIYEMGGRRTPRASAEGGAPGGRSVTGSTCRPTGCAPGSGSVAAPGGRGVPRRFRHWRNHRYGRDELYGRCRPQSSRILRQAILRRVHPVP